MEEEPPKLTKKGQKPRTLTPEHLEKLKIAREKAREVQMKNTEERKKIRELEKETKKLEAEQKKQELIEKHKKLQSKGKIEIEYEEQKPVSAPSNNEGVIGEELPYDEPQNPIAKDVPQKEVPIKKKKKKPVVIVEESGSSDSEEDNIIYVKRRSNKKKELHERNERSKPEPEPKPEPKPEPIIQKEYIYPKNPFFSMNQFRRF